MNESALATDNWNDGKKTAGSGKSLKFSGFICLSLAITSGVLLTLAFPHADLGWIAYLALVPFFRTFPYTKASSAFGVGFVFGFTYFASLLYWIAVFASTKIGGFGVAAWLILSSREALWVGVFAAGVNLGWSKFGWLGRAFLAASLWTVCEYIRQLGELGFGWGDLGYSQWRYLAVLQLASVAGVWGLGWLIVFVNTLLASFQWKGGAVAAAALSVIAGFGLLKINADRPVANMVGAAALQANINEDVPYSGLRPSDSSYFYGTLNTFDQMTAEASQRDRAAVCVTAETSIPGYPALDIPLRLMLGSIARSHNVNLIVGARDTDPQSELDTNSVFVFRPDGTMTGEYNKQQLVPFGEYVPFRNYFPFLKSFNVLDFEMQRGSVDQKPLLIGNGNSAGVAVCYESTYPRFLRQQVQQGATFDIVVTDDTWYGRTAAARQHLAMSAIRAVETGRYLVRCASTGISAVIAPDGKILASKGIFEKGVVAAPIEYLHTVTPFVRFGDWLPIICFVGAAWQLLTKRRGSNISV